MYGMGSTEHAIRSLASAAWLAWVCLASAAQAEPVDAAARALLKAAGMERQLVEWPELNVVVRDRARDALDTDAFARLARDVAEFFAAAALREGVAARLPTQAEPGLVAELQEGFASPRATVLRAMDRESANAEALRGFPRFTSRFWSKRMPRFRLETIRRIDRAQRFSHSVLTVAHGVSQALVHGLGALACTPAPEIAVHAAQERERLERLDPELLYIVWITLLLSWREA